MAPSKICYRCETQYEDESRARCACGEPLWFDMDHSKFEWAAYPDRSSMWRYETFLPVARPTGIALAAGNTPLIRTHRLDEVAGCRVFVKDESVNPTGSYKDRGSAVAVPLALERGSDVVGTVSYGNMAMSTAAHAASMGCECVVLVPTDIPAARVELIGQYSPTILQMEGEYSGLYDEALELNREQSTSLLLSDAPERISGYKTAVFELYESLLPETPDAIVIPASSGGFASGVWRGLLDLHAVGVVEQLPRLYLVQTAASDPITRAFVTDRDEVSAVPREEIGNTIAHSIGNPDPPSGRRALAAARETGGAVLSVSDEEIQDAQRQFAQRGGFCVEPAAATPLAGVVRLTEDEEIGADETVVLIPTGTGFKEMGAGDEPVEIETVTRELLSTRFESIRGR